MRFRTFDTDDYYILSMLGLGLSVTAIGQYLNLSQPAISQRIKAMSDDAGFFITKRKGRNIELTAKGIELSKMSQDIVSILMRALPDASGYRRGDSFIHDVLGKTGDWPTDKSDHTNSRSSD